MQILQASIQCLIRNPALHLSCRRDAQVPTLVYAETFGEAGSNGTASYYLG